MTLRLRGGAIRWIRAALYSTSGATLLAGAGLVLWPALVVLNSAYAQWSGQRLLAATPAVAKDKLVPASRGQQPDRSTLPRGSVLGRFEIPRIKISLVLLEGADDRTLARSIGRIEYTAGLGEPGNIGIAGHRDTHFRKLEWIRQGDEIVLTSPQGKYRYHVEWVRLFKPEDVEVLSPSHGTGMTLITCFPFEYVGSAPLRFIVRALPDENTRARLSASLQPASD